MQRDSTGKLYQTMEKTYVCIYKNKQFRQSNKDMQSRIIEVAASDTNSDSTAFGPDLHSYHSNYTKEASPLLIILFTHANVLNKTSGQIISK